MLVKIISVLIYAVIGAGVFFTITALMIGFGAGYVPVCNPVIFGAMCGGFMRAWYFITRGF